MRADAVFLVLQETLQTKVEPKSTDAEASFVPFLQNASSSDQQQLLFFSSGQEVELSSSEKAILEELLQSLQSFLKGEGDFAKLLEDVQAAIEKADASDLFSHLSLKADAVQTLKEDLSAFLKLAEDQAGKSQEENDQGKEVAAPFSAEASLVPPLQLVANFASEAMTTLSGEEIEINPSDSLSSQNRGVVVTDPAEVDESVADDQELHAEASLEQPLKSDLSQQTGVDPITSKEVAGESLATSLSLAGSKGETAASTEKLVVATAEVNKSVAVDQELYISFAESKEETATSTEKVVVATAEKENGAVSNTQLKVSSEKGEPAVESLTKPKVVVQQSDAVKITIDDSKDQNIAVRQSKESGVNPSLLPAEPQAKPTKTIPSPIPVEVVVPVSQEGDKGKELAPQSIPKETVQPLQFAVANESSGAMESLELHLRKGSKLESPLSKASVEEKLQAIAGKVNRMLQQAVKIVQSRAPRQNGALVQNELIQQPESALIELSSHSKSKTNEKETPLLPLTSLKSSVAKGVSLLQSEPSPALPQPAEVEKAFEQVIKSIQFLKSNHREEARIRLHPPELGEVHIRIGSEKGLLDLQFRAETVQIKQLLEEQLPRLVHALKQNGLSFSSLSVNVGTHTGGESLTAENQFGDPTFGAVHQIDGETEEEALTEATSPSLSEVNLLA